MQPDALPLHGIRVLDFSTMVSGPYCTRLLADMGAEVIKVEAAVGDLIRHTAPVSEHGSRYFHAFNGGKRGVVIDLKRGEGVAIARALAARCDVVVENYRPGVMASFGLDADSPRADHPELVFCSISGFGQTGPMQHWPAYAPIVHALSGFDAVFMAVQGGGGDATPPIASVQVADVLTGAFAFGAIQTALVKRFRTGLGDAIDSTLIESAMAPITGDLQIPQVHPAQRIMTFRAVRAADGWVMPVVLSDKTFASLARVVAPAWMSDSRFVDARARSAHKVEMYAGIEAWTSQRPEVECQATLMRADVPCAIYATPTDVLANEHLQQRGSFSQHSDQLGRFQVNNAPFQLRSTPTPVRGLAPSLGQHTRATLVHVLGLGSVEVEQLFAKGVVA